MTEIREMSTIRAYETQNPASCISSTRMDLCMRSKVSHLLQAGKLDVSEVEGLSDLLAAETTAQHQQV